MSDVIYGNILNRDSELPTIEERLRPFSLLGTFNDVTTIERQV